VSIALPTDIAPDAARPYLIDFGGDLTPALGGAVQRLDRLGSRWGLEVTMPVLDVDEARIWVARLVQAKRSSALFPWPQAGVVGAEGAPRVNGAGQSGTSLAIDGLPAAKGVKEGWFFSIIHNGRRYIHQVASDATASAGGAVTLSIEPMLRVRPADNAVIELAAPMIDGMVQGGDLGWSVELATSVGLSFTLVERE
jgi:hypothetical protein